MARDPENAKAWHRRHYEKNREALVEKSRQYALENPEKIKAGSKRQYEKKRDILLEKTRQWRSANPEKIKASRKKYNAAHAEQLIAAEKERYAKDPEGQKARAAEYRKNNPEKVRETAKRHHQKHRERRAAESKAWRERNPEKTKENRDRWFRENPEKTRLYGHERRAIQRGSGGKVTVAEIQDLWKKQDGKCVYYAVCGNILTDKGPYAAQRDHIEPLKPIDPTKPPGKNSIENIALLCGLCNRRKKNNDPYAFTQRYEGRLFPDLPQKAKR